VVCATPQTVPHDKQGSEYARGNSRLQKIFPARLNEIKNIKSMPGLEYPE
jgi:hypothetical protein